MSAAAATRGVVAYIARSRTGAELLASIAAFSPAERAQACAVIWTHTHSDFKGRTGGDKTILLFRAPHGTCIVGLDSLTDAEIAERLPYCQKLADRAAERRTAKKEAAL